MLETSLSMPSPWGALGAAGAGPVEDQKKREKNPTLGEIEEEERDGVWSMEEESQLLSVARGASEVAPGKTGREEFDLSHAARVA